MLDTKKVGIKIASLRKNARYSQEKLAEMLGLSSTAISKWENGHALPDLSLMPVMAQIFNCTIDEIIMPAYLLDEKIEAEKITHLEQQAEHIAKIIVKQIGDNNMTGLKDQEIIDAVKKFHPDLNKFEISKSTFDNNKRFINVKTPQIELKLVEEIANGHKLHWYEIFSPHTSTVPMAYFIEKERKILLTEDLSEDYIHGDYYNDDNENGEFIRARIKPMLEVVADFHSDFWENEKVFDKLELDWRLASKEYIFAHIGDLEKDFKKYRKNEESGKYSKDGGDYDNNIESYQLDYFEKAILFLRTQYPKLIDSRFKTRQNITIVGKLHPGNVLVPKSAGKPTKIDTFADHWCNPSDRMGLCTEDLAMLIALHIGSEGVWGSEIYAKTLLAMDTAVYKKYMESQLKYYHECLSGRVRDYSYEMLIEDYRISIAENMFHSIGVTDFLMRDKAIKAFEAFVL